jgi:hypothetical protein
MTIQTTPAARTRTVYPDRAAVAYVDDEHAIVVKDLADGSVSVEDIARRRPEDISYLVRIVDAIGERARVAILGPDDLRLALEREYVAVHHRPDQLVDVEDASRETAAQLIARLEELRG